MRAKFLIQSLMASATAQIFPLIPRQKPIVEYSSACITALGGIGNPPQIPSAILTAVPAPRITDACDYTPPASLSVAWHSYTVEIKLWASSKSAELQSVATACPGVTAVPNLNCQSVGIKSIIAPSEARTLIPVATHSVHPPYVDTSAAASCSGVAIGALFGVGFIAVIVL